MAYADLLLNGAESQYAGWFAEGDPLNEAVGRAAKDAKRALPEYQLSDLTWTAEEDAQVPLMLVTNDGGALLATSFIERERMVPREEGVTLEPSGPTRALTGIETSESGIESDYQLQVLFAIPPASAGDDARIQVMGYSQALVGAREVQ